MEARNIPSLVSEWIFFIVLLLSTMVGWLYSQETSGDASHVKNQLLAKPIATGCQKAWNSTQPQHSDTDFQEWFVKDQPCYGCFYDYDRPAVAHLRPCKSYAPDGCDGCNCRCSSILATWNLFLSWAVNAISCDLIFLQFSLVLLWSHSNCPKHCFMCFCSSAFSSFPLQGYLVVAPRGFCGIPFKPPRYFQHPWLRRSLTARSWHWLLSGSSFTTTGLFGRLMPSSSPRSARTSSSTIPSTTATWFCKKDLGVTTSALRWRSYPTLLQIMFASPQTSVSCPQNFAAECPIPMIDAVQESQIWHYMTMSDQPGMTQTQLCSKISQIKCLCCNGGRQDSGKM